MLPVESYHIRYGIQSAPKVHREKHMSLAYHVELAKAN